MFFNFHLGKWSHLTNIFQMGWSHQLENRCKTNPTNSLRLGDKHPETIAATRHLSAAQQVWRQGDGGDGGDETDDFSRKLRIFWVNLRSYFFRARRSDESNTDMINRENSNDTSLACNYIDIIHITLLYIDVNVIWHKYMLSIGTFTPR